MRGLRFQVITSVRARVSQSSQLTICRSSGGVLGGREATRTSVRRSGSTESVRGAGRLGCLGECKSFIGERSWFRNLTMDLAVRTFARLT